MKNKFLTSIFVTFIFITFSSCNWLIPKCEGYYIYELENYRLDIIDYAFTKKYSDFRLYISADKNLIEETDYCSLMEDSFVNYITKIDIYSETDYNQEFPAGVNLNELFKGLFSTLNTNIRDSLPANTVENASYNHKPGIIIFLIDEPEKLDTFIFSINIEINDGRIYNFETKPVVITP